MQLVIRGVLRVLFHLLFFGALLFLPIGTWNWPRALWFLGLFGLISLATTLAMARWSPASLEARVKKGAVKDQPRGDKVVSFLLGFTHLAWFIFIPNDVFRWELLPRPSLWISILGMFGCFLGYGIMLAAVMQNAFAAPIVGDQSEREQVLVDSGLYAWVRHPMYAGHLLFLLGLPLWLESYAAALVVPVVFAPLIGRILVEERAMGEGLAGYADYTRKVRYRLVPLIW